VVQCTSRRLILGCSHSDPGCSALARWVMSGCRDESAQAGRPPSDAARKCDKAQHCIFEILNILTTLNKINLMQKYVELYIYPTKPSAGLPNLARLSF
jgi:hypothetical protein